jgi:hypothetical protein
MPKTFKPVTSRTKVTTGSVRKQGDFLGHDFADLNQAYLGKAAEVIAIDARARARKFSIRIPVATTVQPGYVPAEVVIITDGDLAPNAAPFEYGKRHPLFGDTNHWYPTPFRPYMSQAFRSKGAEALEVYAQVLDYMAKEWSEE